MSSNGSVREPSEHAEISSVDRDELHTDGNALFADAGEAATPAAQPSSAFAGDAYDEHHDHRASAGHSVNAHIPASATAAPPVRQLTAEEAVEARIAAARLRMSEARGARSASGGSASGTSVPAPFYVGDARPLTPRTGAAAPRPKVLKAYGYPAAPPPGAAPAAAAAAAETAPHPASSAEPEPETAATAAAAAAAAAETHSAVEAERSASAAASEAEAEAAAALRARNRALEAENDVLRVRQSEATAAVLSAQHRHEANLVKLRDKQARQGQLLQDKDARIAELTASAAALGDAAQAGKVSEEQLKALQQKLQRKDTMLAEMRLALDRYAADKRKADAASEDKRAQHAKVLQRIDAGRRKHSRSKPLDGDAEVEAILADVDLSALPEVSAEAVYRLVGVVASCRAEVSRLRVVRTSSPAAGAFSRMSAAESGGGAPLRTSSPIAVRRGGSPMRTTPRELEKEGPKGEAAWQLWADKKKRQAAAAAAAGSVPDHATPWRGGGLNRRPAQRAPSPLTRGRVVPGQEAPQQQQQQQQPPLQSHSQSLPAQQAQPQQQHRAVPHVSYKMTPAADTPQDKVLPTPQDAPPLTPGTVEEPPPPPQQQQQQPSEQHTVEGAEEAQQQASEEGEADHIDMDAGEPRVQARAHQYTAPPPGLLALVSSSRRVQQHVACED